MQPDNLSAQLALIIPNVSFYVKSAPIFIMFIGSILSLLVGVFRAKPSKPHFPAFGIVFVSTLSAFVSAALNISSNPATYLAGAFLSDSLSQFAMSAIAIFSGLTLLIASLTTQGRNLLRYELVSLIGFASAGLMIMVSAGEFMSFFAGLEMTSLSLYVLVGYQREDFKGFEAAMKYFLLGSVAAGMLLMGQALIYLNTGSLSFSAYSTLNLSPSHPLALLGVVLLFSGLAFKLALAPFHSWAPDVYQGANATLTGYMASIVKFSLVVVFIRILSIGVKTPSPLIVNAFWIMGALSILIGSLFGLVHNSIKRMLAYSSIANAGYFCLAFTALVINPTNELAKQALLAYSVIYALLSIGGFGIVAWLEEGNKEDLMRDEIAGLGKTNPFAAVVLSIILFGLAGVPPLAGFFGKFMIIQAAVSENLIGIAIIMVVLSCVSLYYYLSLLVEIWFKPLHRHSVQTINLPTKKLAQLVFGILAFLIVGFGIVGPRFTELVTKSATNQKEAAMLPEDKTAVVSKNK